MNLVENWRKAPGMFSVQCFTAITSIVSTWLLIPDDIMITLPAYTPKVVGGVILMLAIGGTIGRLIDQPSVK